MKFFRGVPLISRKVWANCRSQKHSHDAKLQDMQQVPEPIKLKQVQKHAGCLMRVQWMLCSRVWKQSLLFKWYFWNFKANRAALLVLMFFQCWVTFLIASKLLPLTQIVDGWGICLLWRASHFKETLSTYLKNAPRKLLSNSRQPLHSTSQKKLLTFMVASLKLNSLTALGYLDPWNMFKGVPPTMNDLTGVAGAFILAVNSSSCGNNLDPGV